ncbi:MAG: hypothetical protein ACR2IT_08250 [Pirellulales bacterium]
MTGDMTSAATTNRLPSNPFSTRFTRPGMLPPLDQEGVPVDVGRLLAGLHAGGLAIEGPHGHGKTNLLHAVLAAAVAAGRPTGFFRIGSQDWGWRALFLIGRARPETVVGIDGWELLSPGLAGLLRVAATCRRATIVATTHGPARMPVLARCETSPRLLAAIVDRLPAHGGCIAKTDIDEAFHRHEGNVREALYDLYDRFERRVR